MSDVRSETSHIKHRTFLRHTIGYNSKLRLMPDQTLFWIVFNAFVVLMLFLDLKVFHRKSHVIEFREALGWSAFWVSLAMAFAVGIYFLWPDPAQRGQKTIEFVTGYLIEESLSVDNLFVFLLIFSYFKVPRLYQHKVLFWGIIGALVMRLAFILAGVALIRRFHDAREP